MPEIGATGSIVARLTMSIRGQQYKVYMDRFYNSPALSQYLLRHGIQSCGTIQTNHKNFPTQLRRTKKDMKRGESDYVCRGPVSFVVWCDQSPIYLSTFHKPTEIGKVDRKNKDGTTESVTCPEVVAEYTRNMGGCDLNDQMTKLYKTRKHYRWPRRLQLKCMTWCLFNAYIFYRILKPDIVSGIGHRAFTFQDFVDEVLFCNVYSISVYMILNISILYFIMC